MRYLSVVLAALVLTACGSSKATSSAPSTRSQPPPSAQVSQAVVSLIATCDTYSFSPATTSIGPVSIATGTLVRLAHTYSMTATMNAPGIKATTLRDALSNLLPVLQKCSPADASRVDDVLYASG